MKIKIKKRAVLFCINDLIKIGNDFGDHAVYFFFFFKLHSKLNDTNNDNILSRLHFSKENRFNNYF